MKQKSPTMLEYPIQKHYFIRYDIYLYIHIHIYKYIIEKHYDIYVSTIHIHRLYKERRMCLCMCTYIYSYIEYLALYYMG